MVKRNSNARWEGSLHEGRGKLKLGSGVYEGPYTFASRFKDEEGTNPEELIAGAESGCFSMALSMILGENGYTPENIETDADVHLDPDELEITKVELETRAKVPGIDEDEFVEYAQEAKENCPVSKALATEIDLDARLD